MEQQVANFLYKVPHVLNTPVEAGWGYTTGFGIVEWTQDNWWVPITACTIYLAFIFFGQKVMKERERFNLRTQLGLWNAFLCLFSFLGMCHTVPTLFGNILTWSYEETVCSHPGESWGRGPTGFWVALFIYSKIPELIDTVFIVLRKRPLIFLHWYHHVTVLLFCWSAYATMAASGLYFVAMNYSVHALMYGYYSLQAFGVCPKSFPAILITASQISQMFVGTFVCASAWYYKLYSNNECSNDQSNLIAGALMYGSYLYLFMEFFVNRYIFKNKDMSKYVAQAYVKPEAAAKKVD